MGTKQAKILAKAIEEDLPQPWTNWPGGYPDDVEVALIDAVLSIRTQYGSHSNGVRGAITKYRAQHGNRKLDSLSRLASYTPSGLETVLGVQQKTSGVPKAQAIVEVATSLNKAGVEGARDVDPEAHKRHYTRVHGLGWVTWEYFTMLIGHPGIKSDTWIIRWVSEAIGEPVSAREASQLLKEAADLLGIATTGKKQPNITQLDHAIWNEARQAGRS